MNIKPKTLFTKPLLEDVTWLKKEQALKVRLKAFLEQVVQSKSQHSRWLNTLAFLEYIGCRKIIKSQHSDNLTLMLLQHISEEARHAYHFKKLAHKISPKDVHDFKEEKTLKGSLAEDYFQAIDYKTKEDLDQTDFKEKAVGENPPTDPKAKVSHVIDLKASLNYLYTTWLIEERALMVYNVYNLILKAGAFPFNLDFILKEETGHLKTTVDLIHKKDPTIKERSDRLFHFEQEQFAGLLKAWCPARFYSITADG